MAIKCKNCGLDYLREVDYCGQCGTQLREPQSAAIVCYSCGKPAHHEAIYCIECGKKLSQKTKQK